MGNALCQCCENQRVSKLSEISLQAYSVSQEKKGQRPPIESYPEPDELPDLPPNEDFGKEEKVVSSLFERRLRLRVMNSGNLETTQGNLQKKRAR